MSKLTFDKAIIENLKRPYKFTGFTLKQMKFFARTGLINIMWNKPLKQNSVFDKNLDRPFIQ